MSIILSKSDYWIIRYLLLKFKLISLNLMKNHVTNINIDYMIFH